MNPDLEEAYREAIATARSSAVVLDTLQITHPVISESLFLLRYYQDLNLTLETGVQQVFTACGIKVTMPGTGENGRQEMGLALCNVDQKVQQFMHLAKTSFYPVKVQYRPYLLEDLTTPQREKPLTLYLTDVVVTLFEVTGRASFTDFINRPFPRRTETYNRDRFPSLGD